MTEKCTLKGELEWMIVVSDLSLKEITEIGIDNLGDKAIIETYGQRVSFGIEKSYDEMKDLLAINKDKATDAFFREVVKDAKNDYKLSSPEYVEELRLVVMYATPMTKFEANTKILAGTAQEDICQLLAKDNTYVYVMYVPGANIELEEE